VGGQNIIKKEAERTGQKKEQKDPLDKSINHT